MIQKVFEKVHLCVAWVMQAMTFLYSMPASRLCMRLSIQRPKNLVIYPGTLIIANHQSKSDPFLITYYIGFRNILRNSPLSFPVTHDYMSKPLTGFYLRLLNCFDVGETMEKKAHALIKIRDLLRQKKTVVLFPEGSINHKGDQVQEFHKGLDMLFKSNNVPLVMVRFEGLNSWSLFDFSARSTMCFEKIPDGLTLEEKRTYISEFYKSQN